MASPLLTAGIVDAPRATASGVASPAARSFDQPTSSPKIGSQQRIPEGKRRAEAVAEECHSGGTTLHVPTPFEATVSQSVSSVSSSTMPSSDGISLPRKRRSTVHSSTALADKWLSPFVAQHLDPLASELPDVEIRRIAQTLLLLSLYGGPDKVNGLDKMVIAWGASIKVYDLEISEAHDLVDDSTWSDVRHDLRDGKFDSAGIASPCSTFSAGRKNDGGPRPLRGEHPPDIYGFKYLTPKEKEQVRIGTCCAFRGFEAANFMLDQNKTFWHETPRQQPGKPSLYKLPEGIKLSKRDGVSTKTFVQCPLGSPTTKPTDLMSAGIDTSKFPTVCTHEPRWWVLPWCKSYHWGAHPLLQGRQWMIPSESWTPEMWQWHEPSGPYISRSAAAYPDGMNQLIADTWVAGCAAAKLRLTQSSSMVRTGYWSNKLVASHLTQSQAPQCGARTQLPQVAAAAEAGPSLLSDHGDNRFHDGHSWNGNVRHTGTPAVTQHTPLRPQPEVAQDPLYNPTTCVGGLVDAWKSVQRVPGHFAVGQAMGNIMQDFFDANPAVEQELFAAIGKDDVDPHRMDTIVADLRDSIAKSLSDDGKLIDQTPVSTELYDTNIRAFMLFAWLSKANDPGLSICRWLWEGAPAGLEQDFACLDGLFPRVDASDTEYQPDELFTDFDEFINYQGVESDDAVSEVLKGYCDKGYFKTFDSIDEAQAWLGQRPILTKVGAVKKTKVNPVTGTEKIKTRIIVDSKQAKTSLASKRTHKSNLPTATGASRGFLGLMANSSYHPHRAGIEFFVIDISDAFWLIPLMHKERKYFVIKYRGKYMVFLRTAQGSRGAPLTWAAVASLLCRCAQSLFMTSSSQAARLQTYVDDPILGVQGTPAERRRMVVKFIAFFLVMGVRLAFDKAQLNHTVLWVGVTLRVRAWEIDATVPQEKLTDLEAIIVEMMSSNVVAVKPLRSFAGKCTNIATLVYAWRPFLNQIWAALSQHDTELSRAPTQCVWTKQIVNSLTWLLAFIRGQQGSITRTFSYNSCFGITAPVVITTDASIYGYGAWISLAGRPIAWFSESISAEDEAVLGHKHGENEGQQGFEAMALLLAVRVWAPIWQSSRVSLSLRNDNVGALTVFSSLKGKSCPMNAVAREFALDMAQSAYEPSLIQHLPGVTNKVADVLSRRCDPKYADTWSVPQYLTSNGAKKVSLPPRLSAWWKARSPPGYTTKE